MQLESFKSLFLQMFFNDQPLGTGTGFIAMAPRGPVLVTNRHNLTGRRQDNQQPIHAQGGIPNILKVGHTLKQPNDHNLRWSIFPYRLYDDNQLPLWAEHPVHGSAVDFVALPLEVHELVELLAFDVVEPRNRISLLPAETVSVVGFPFGLTGGGLLAIWSTGFLATEHQIDYDNLPRFLIDCRGRPGQSGSPVLAARDGSVQFANGSWTAGGGRHTEFLGIYSGRVNEQSDLGFVWKRSAIHELVISIV